MDTGRIETPPEPMLHSDDDPKPKKVYPRLTIDGKSEAYKEMIDEVKIDDEMKFVVDARVCTISSSSGNDWENRIEIEIRSINPVSSAAFAKMNKEFGD